MDVSARGAARIDPVRASRDGHQFHEAWAARSALALLPPDTNLVAIAMEGFSREDDGAHSQTATEVADLVRYYGGRTVAEADRIEVVQFKYSIASAEIPVRASDLRATVAKFAKGEAERIDNFGEEIARRAHYEFATNRPIHENLTRDVQRGDLAQGITIAHAATEQTGANVGGNSHFAGLADQALPLLGSHPEDDAVAGILPRRTLAARLPRSSARVILAHAVSPATSLRRGAGPAARPVVSYTTHPATLFPPSSGRRREPERVLLLTWVRTLVLLFCPARRAGSGRVMRGPLSRASGAPAAVSAAGGGWSAGLADGPSRSGSSPPWP